MRDVHCHILPGVDDGARTMSESLMMLSAAMKAGVTSIVCTPRCCDPFFDFERMWQAYLQFKHHVSAIPGAPELSMGFEVDYYKLRKLGMDAAVQLGNDQGEFLLSLPDGTLPLDWEYLVHKLQRKGFKVIIAHPERCREVQKDIEVARRFILAGCELQISASCVYGGLLDPARRAAKKLVQAGMVHHLASDARRPDDYELLTEAMEYFKRLTDSEAMENKSIEEVEHECAEAEARAERRKGSAEPAFEGVPASSQPDGAAYGEEPASSQVLTSGQEAYRVAKAALASEPLGAPSVAASKPDVVRPATSAAGKHASTEKPASKLEGLAMPDEQAQGARKPYEAPTETSAEAALDSMFEEEPIRGKHARRA